MRKARRDFDNVKGFVGKGDCADSGNGNIGGGGKAMCVSVLRREEGIRERCLDTRVGKATSTTANWTVRARHWSARGK